MNNKKMKDIDRIITSVICCAGILSLSNVNIKSLEYWIIVSLLIIYVVTWGRN